MDAATPTRNSRHAAIQMSLLIFGASVLASLTFHLLLPSAFAGDDYSDFSHYYEPIALNLLNGNGYTGLRGEVPTANPPGHPVLLAGLFQIAKVLGLAQETVLTVATMVTLGLVCALQFLIARQVSGERGGIAASLLWLTYPPLLWLTRAFYSELPFMVLLYAGILTFMVAQKRDVPSGKLYFSSGLMVGLALMFRSVALGLSLVLAVLVVFKRASSTVTLRMRLGALLVAGTVSVILPWTLWLYANTGEFIIVGTNGPSSVRDGLTFALSYENKQRTDTRVPRDVEEVMVSFYNSSVHREMESMGAIVGVLQREFQQRPFAVLQLFSIKIVRSWFATDTGRLQGALALLQFPYLTLSLLGSSVVWRRGVQHRWLLLNIWGIICYFWLMTILVLSILRYMIPAMGLLHILGAIPLTMLWNKV